MRNITFLLLFCVSLLGFNTSAQQPTVTHADYSTKKGVVKDWRDGKKYAFKAYGDRDWFIQNLAYEGVVQNSAGADTKGRFLQTDPTGAIYGMLYPSATNNNGTTLNKFCPEGWTAANKADYKALFNNIAETYELTDVSASGDNYTNLAKYLRAGGVDGTNVGGLWKTASVIDAKAAQIGFNALPAGVLDSGTGSATGADATGTKASFLTGTWYHYFMTSANETVSHTNRNSNHHGAIRCMRPASSADGIVTPYPTTIELKQIDGAEKERIRLGHTQKKFEQQPTGFYLEKGKTAIVNLEVLSAATDGSSPSIVIGTTGQINNTVKTISLSPGLNTIDSTKHSGGLIYLRYITNGAGNPQGKVKITFAEEGEHIRAPQYIYGKTTDEEFAVMMDKYAAAGEAVFYTDHFIAVASRAHAITYSLKEDKDKWMKGLSTIFEKEDEISGMNDADINPVHHRLRAGEVRYLMVCNSSSSPHASSAGYTAYPASTVKRYLTYDGTYNQSWMLAHEVGHQHQQGAYLISQATESTVNIYSYVVSKHITEEKGSVYNRTTAARWTQTQNTYLSLPIEERIYNMPDSEIQAITGFNRDELRFMPWEQMMIIFGADFYKTLHRITREEKVTGGSEQEKRAYLILKASQVSGYDLRGFFNEWGIRVTDAYSKIPLDRKVDEALADGSILALPYSDTTLTQVTGQNRPTWAPLALRGITTSSPDTSNNHPTDELASKNKYTDYSTSKGVFTDTRDGKKYTFKQYGSLDWFTQNLDYIDERVQNSKPVSIYPPADPTGEVYGRMYSTNTASSTYSGWCPKGWRTTTQQDWTNLYAAIKSEYGLKDSQLVSCMIGGGDRDDNSDGLWRKGTLGFYGTDEQRREVGFNILPAGVYSHDAKGYDSGDGRGFKASFFEPNSIWQHQVFVSDQTTITRTSRNTKHYGSIRCVRTAVNTLMTESRMLMEDTQPEEVVLRSSSDGGVLTVSCDKTIDSLEIYSVSSSQKVAEVSVNNTTVSVPLLPGIYAVNAIVEGKLVQVKVIVK